MENAVLKKRLNAFKTGKNRYTRVGDEVLIDILRGWEQWTRTSKEFYSSLGLSKTQFAVLMKKAKKIHREEQFSGSEFKELKVVSNTEATPVGNGVMVEMTWDNGKVIRFSQVEQLVDFLKKVS